MNSMLGLTLDISGGQKLAKASLAVNKFMIHSDAGDTVENPSRRYQRAADSHAQANR